MLLGMSRMARTLYVQNVQTIKGNESGEGLLVQNKCDSISSPYSDTFPPATINRLLKGKSQEKVCWSRIRRERDSISSPYSDTFPPATINRL
jgi:hypothetical protein